MTEHNLVEWTSPEGYGEECLNCTFKYAKKHEGQMIIITPKFYESEEYQKCDNKKESKCKNCQDVGDLQIVRVDNGRCHECGRPYQPEIVGVLLEDEKY
jgi:hypothetical protein